jgi:hypothetical protein
MSRVAARALAFAAALFVTHSLYAADYYFDAGQVSNGSGSAASPFNSLAPLNTIDLNPGDNVYLNGAFTAPAGGIQLGSIDSGTPSAPVNITSLNPASPAIINAANGPGLNAVNVSGISLSNLQFVGSGPASVDPTGIFTNTADGVRFYADQGVKQNYVHINNVVAQGFGQDGIHVQGANGASGFNDVQITNVTARDNQVAGVSLDGDFANANRAAHTNVLIDHVAAYDNSGRANRPDEGNSGSGIVIGQVDGGVIQRSVAYNNGFACQSTQGGPVGIWAWDSNDIKIQHNTAFDNHTGGQYDGAGFDLDGGVTNSVMQYNYSHDNDGAGFLLAQFDGAKPFSGNTVRYNISQDDGRKNGYGAIHAFGSIGQTDVYNNTIYMAGADPGQDEPAAVKLRAGTKQIRLANNLLVISDVAGTKLTSIPEMLDIDPAASGYSFLRNDYFSTDGTAITNPADPMSMNVDPQVVNLGGGGTILSADQLATLTDYLLTLHSPLIDQGVNLGALFGIDMGGQDFYGLGPHGAGYDIGAAESAIGLEIPPVAPEPASLGIMGAGALMLMRRRRRA